MVEEFGMKMRDDAMMMKHAIQCYTLAVQKGACWIFWLDRFFYCRVKALSIGLIFASVSATFAMATEVAVSFRDVGYGTFGGSQLQNIANPNSLLGLPGISNVEFVQDTVSGRFEAIQTGCDSQGNDVAVTVRMTADAALINGVSNGYISFLGCVNWLDQPGGKIEGFGFMQPIGGSFTIDYTRVRIHNQNMTRAAKAHAERKILGHLS